jgi:hypothetical protein
MNITGRRKNNITQDNQATGANLAGKKDIFAKDKK